MSIQPNGKVLILGKDTRSFLTVIRSLGRKQLQVHVGWCPPESEAAESRYIQKNHLIPPYTSDDDEWKKTLILLMKQEQFDLIIPCNDQTLIPLQLHRNELEQWGVIYLLNDHAFSVVFDKYQTNELARSLDIPVPREYCLSKTKNDVEAVVSNFSWPVVIKPGRSYSLGNISKRNSVRKANDMGGFLAHIEALHSCEEVLVQENCPGIGVGVEVLVQQGNVLVAFQHERVHEPLSGGGSTYRKSVSIAPDLYDAVKKLMSALNYSGVAMVEFKADAETQKWVLIEINGRFWGSLPLAVACGVDFPYYLYRMLVCGEQVFPKDYQEGIYCRNYQRDLIWMVKNIQARGLPEVENTLPLWQVVKEVMNILKLREYNDTLLWDDPKPGLREFQHLFNRGKVKVQDKILAVFFSCGSIRRLYQSKVLRALKKAQTVVFVCKGNICRSPFADRYARTIFPESVRILSCGYYPKNGRVCPQEAVSVAKEFGVNLFTHRSLVVNEQIVQEAHIVFVFDEQNQRTLLAMFPWAKRKIVLLGLLNPRGVFSVKDPYGGTLNEFRTIYTSIIQALDVYKNKFAGNDR